MNYIYATIGIFFLVVMNQLHAATPTVITGEQACKMKSGARGTLNSIQYISGATTKAVVSGESKVNMDKTIWKGRFLKSGTSVYYMQITATGGHFIDINTDNLEKGGFSKKISDIALYKYNCIKKTNILISKENLYKVSDIKVIHIDWIKNGYVKFNILDPTYKLDKYILSENTGKILDFSQYKGYMKDWENIEYEYSTLGKIKLINRINNKNSYYTKIYTINTQTKEIRYLYRTAEDYYAYPMN